MQHLQRLIDWSFESGGTRSSVVVGFGGGALMNITGLFAGIVYRGFRLVYIPTTLLAMHDVTTSLKTSICHWGRKNNIGVYYAATLILMDLAFCRTLPQDELLSGLGELCKNAALFGGDHAAGFVGAFSKDLLNECCGGAAESLTLEDSDLIKLTRLGVRAKMDILCVDATENLQGMVFEYGHTFSHAIEKAYGDGRIPHGIGVCYGMLCCSHVASRLGIMSEEARGEHDAMVRLLTDRWALPEPKPSMEKVMGYAMGDSKRGILKEEVHEITDLVLSEIGSIVSDHPSNLAKFDKKYVEEWLELMGFHTESLAPGIQARAAPELSAVPGVIEGAMELDFLNFADRKPIPAYTGVDVQQEVVARLLDLNPDRFLVVTDEAVEKHHESYLDALGATGIPVHKIVLPCGDQCKSMQHLQRLIDWSFESGGTRSSVVVGFGGGALMNITGLFAGIVYRGFRLVYIPTTLLAMHDVTTSLKTSICHWGRKNNIGVYYAATLILMDLAFCRTLPQDELLSGLGELCKNAALFGGDHAAGFVGAFSKDLLNECCGGAAESLTLEDSDLIKLTRLGVRAKMDILCVDATENLQGMVFEYGHTFSHAIEKAYGDGRIPHGIGVCYGMLCCSHVASRLGIMSEEARGEHDAMVRLLTDRWALPEPKPSMEKVMGYAMGDSKRGILKEEVHEITDLVLSEIGSIVSDHPSNLAKFDKKYVEEWLELMGFQSQ